MKIKKKEMITLAFASLSEKFPNYELFKRHNTQKDKFIKFEGTEKEKEINEFFGDVSKMQNLVEREVKEELKRELKHKKRKN